MKPRVVGTSWAACYGVLGCPSAAIRAPCVLASHSPGPPADEASPFTYLRATLIHVRQNVTLALPAETLRRLKVLAAERDSSISRMLTEQLDELLDRESGYDAARRRALASLERGLPLGMPDRVPWSRDDLHER